MTRELVLACLLLVSGFTQISHAGLITYSAGFGPQTFSLGTQINGSVASGSSSTLNWNGSLTLNFLFPQFDPSLGTLNDVRLTFAGATGLTADVLLSTTQLFTGINVNMTTNFAFNDATNAIASTGSNFVNNSFTTAGSLTSPINFNVGSAGVVGTLVSVPVSNHANYVGLGSMTLPMNVQFLAQATTSNGRFAVTPFPVLVMSPVQLTYDFTPVPEPSVLSLCFATIAFFVPTRRNRNRYLKQMEIFETQRE